jgi:hypothetical protein
MARDHLYNHRCTLQDREDQELVAEQLDFAIRHRAVEPHMAERATGIMRRLVRVMLGRKRLTPQQRQQILARWKHYHE